MINYFKWYSNFTGTLSLALQKQQHATHSNRSLTKLNLLQQWYLLSLSYKTMQLNHLWWQRSVEEEEWLHKPSAGIESEPQNTIRWNKITIVTHNNLLTNTDFTILNIIIINLCKIFKHEMMNLNNIKL